MWLHGFNWIILSNNFLRQNKEKQDELVKLLGD